LSEEEGIHMRARLIVAVVLALVLCAVLAAPAMANHTHKGLLISTAELTFIMTDPETEDGYWSGSVRGSVRGTMQMNGLDVYESGDPWVFTFTERFTITTRCGSIEGYVIGIMPDMGFSSCGWVTNATGRWSRTLEWMVYQAGEVVESDGTYVTRSHLVFMPPFTFD
jgi:hypothetical protein